MSACVWPCGAVKNIRWHLKADRTDIETLVKRSIGSALVVLMGVFHNAEACGNTRGKSAYKGVWYHCTCSAGYTQPAFLMSDLSDSAHKETNYEGRNISSYIIFLSFTAVTQNRTFIIHLFYWMLLHKKCCIESIFIYLTWYQYFQLPELETEHEQCEN